MSQDWHAPKVWTDISERDHDFFEQKRIKLDRISALIRPEFRRCRTQLHYDCLDDEARRIYHIVGTSNISENPYHAPAMQLIGKHQGGLVLDFGAGKRHDYYSNVVNHDVVAYDSTDVLAVGERLPFVDAVFDAVHCNAVLEHVKDPFACAKEIVRILKPGGDLMCCVPLLQPYHGFPRHYYNMTHQGLRNLFEGIHIVGVEVYEELRPITSLQWIISTWAASLPEAVQKQFLQLRLGDIAAKTYSEVRTEPYVTQLPAAANQELACCNTLFGRKQRADEDAQRLVCSKATFGADSAWADVTRIINGLITDNQLFLSCTTDLYPMFGDPIPGTPKKLVVRWRNACQSGEVTVGEYDGRLVTPLWL